MALLVGCGADEEEVDWVDPGAFPGGEQGGADGVTGSPSETSSTSTESTSNGGGGESSGVDQDAVGLYTGQCASCHGVRGEGISGPSLQRWSQGVEALVDRIDRTMPPGQPEICRGVCAERLARYILDTLDTDEPSLCDEEGVDVLPERRLRLLTRREYAQTIRDLFHLDDASEEQACQPQRFVFDPQGGRYDTVHVAGTFNDWSPTIAGGGWPMVWDAAAGLWVVERALEEGTYAYKFVLNEAEWRQDANNPDAAPDGVGGFNSVVEVTCGQGGVVVLPEDLPANFPVESRPEGYTYDNNAAAGLVTATHMSEYLDAAAWIAPQAVDGLLARLECSSGQACAQAVVEQFGLRAYRRPLDAEERGRLVGLVLEADRFRDGVEIALRVMLSSPHFLYRSEMGEPQGDGTWVLTAWEVATALSYTFWGTMPDEVLLAAAESGALDTPAGIELQARRLLGDVRSRAMWST
ncbi:MAG: DUF1595 domain-containing protein, partial [Myxococcota bacterium]